MSFSKFTRAPEVSAEFAGRVHGLLCASALGDALGSVLAGADPDGSGSGEGSLTALIASDWITVSSFGGPSAALDDVYSYGNSSLRLGNTFLSPKVGKVVSTEGGMDIEAVAHDTPEKIVTFAVDPATGVMPHHGRALAKALGLSGDLAKQAEGIVTKLYAAFTAKDMSMLEINPLVVTGEGAVVALDAKMNFDDNALFRQPDVEGLRDEDEEDPTELEAGRHGLNYVNVIAIATPPSWQPA